MQGSGNAGKMILLFSKDKDHQPTITQLSVNDLDKQFDLLNKTLNEKIVLGTGIPRILSGVETAVGLSDTSKILEQANRQWFNESIKYSQYDIVDMLNKIFMFNNQPLVRFRNESQNIFTLGVSEQTLLTMFTEDELRKALGYEPKNKLI